jgi:hypothetical protein
MSHRCFSVDQAQLCIAQCDPQRSWQCRPLRLRQHSDGCSGRDFGRASGERPRDCGAAEERDELAPSQLIELHPVPYQPGPDRRNMLSQGVSEAVHKECRADVTPSGRCYLARL